MSTSYTVEGSTVVQHVATDAGTAYPVVADPSVTFGWYVYVHLSPADQRAFLQGGIWGAGSLATAICLGIGPGALVCAVGATALAGIISSYISDKYNPRCDMKIAFHYSGGIHGY